MIKYLVAPALRLAAMPRWLLDERRAAKAYLYTEHPEGGLYEAGVRYRAVLRRCPMSKRSWVCFGFAVFCAAMGLWWLVPPASNNAAIFMFLSALVEWVRMGLSDKEDRELSGD